MQLRIIDHSALLKEAIRNEGSLEEHNDFMKSENREKLTMLTKE